MRQTYGHTLLQKQACDATIMPEKTMGRSYESSHPWLNFTLDLRRVPWDLWVMLGECQSKCEHIAGTPLRPDVSRLLHSVYLAKGVAATTAIEGNTLSEEQVRQQIEGILKVAPSKEYLKQEVENILEGCNTILAEIESGTLPSLSPARIKDLNRLVLRNLQLADEQTVPGEFRKHTVGVMDYRGAPPEDCEFLVEKLCRWLNEMTFPPGKEILEGIVKAVVAHLYLAWIHPFGDGNGRTARLVEVQILLCSGVPSPAAQLLSNHYNQTRSEYYRQLGRSSKSGGDPMPFLHYAIQGLRDGLAEQIGDIRSQHIEVAWTNYVHDAFADLEGEADGRRKRLILQLSASAKDWVTLDELSRLTPELAVDYHEKSQKMIVRDVERLAEMGLIEREGRSVRANKTAILAFLPTRARASKGEGNQKETQ
ncbi:MAG TPA: Fic family protein [Verrucomicrobiae bacterium]|nr:Fic family protein [Verrucomicrobiae bacterium]